MEYVRTKDNIYKLKEPYYVDKTNHLCWRFSLLPLVIHNMGEITKQANKITDLITTGDLLIVEDLTKKATFPIIYNEKVPFDYESPIYRLKEIYIKDTKSNFIKVAKMNVVGELELL